MALSRSEIRKLLKTGGLKVTQFETVGIIRKIFGRWHARRDKNIAILTRGYSRL